jgi:hypothetical protein
MTKSINYLVMFCLGVNLTSVNYLFGYFLNVSGQQISLIVNAICLAIVVLNIDKLLRIRLLILTLILVVVIPFLGYLANYYGQDSSHLVFWFKRAATVIVILATGLIVTTRVSNETLVIYTEILLIIICCLVLYSWWRPYDALVMFTAEDEERWGELATISRSGAAGAFINVNNAGIAMVGMYVAYQAFLVTSKIQPGLVHSALLDGLLLICILIGGSRGTFAIGFMCIAVVNLYYGNQGNSNKYVQPISTFSIRAKRLSSIVMVILIGGVLMFITDASGSSGAGRILDFLSGTEGLSSYESTVERFAAVAYALDIFYENPILGVGFDAEELRNVILPHNMIVYYGVTNGIFGAVFFVHFISKIISSITARVGSVSLGICYVLVLGGFSFLSHSLIEEKNFPWLIVAAAYLIRQYSQTSDAVHGQAVHGQQASFAKTLKFNHD